MSLHQMGAAFFAIPDLALEKNEAKAMAEAIAEVSKYYSIPGLNPAHAAVVSLFLVMLTTYGKRVPAILRGPVAARQAEPPPASNGRDPSANIAGGEVPPWFSSDAADITQ